MYQLTILIAFSILLGGFYILGLFFTDFLMLSIALSFFACLLLFKFAIYKIVAKLKTKKTSTLQEVKK